MAQIDVGSELAGHRLEAIIGRGGMGVVYRARDLDLDRVVALKVIAPEFASDRDFRERFKRESQLAASIRHPNVISIYRAGEQDDQLFITMDYVEGTDLKAIIAVRGRLDPTLAASLVSQVAGGLDAAHARGLVHRDVKPANVLIENRQGDQRAYLTDFGLTKRAKSQSALTKTGMVVGTTDYLAPEQLEGGPIDARVDVYALGCVLYEALTGHVPYPRDTDAATMWAHMSEEAPSVLAGAPDVPAEFDAVVRRAMAKDRNERFLSAEDMGRAVTAAAAGAPAPSAGIAKSAATTAAHTVRSEPARAAEAAAAGDPTTARRHVKRKGRRAAGERGDATQAGGTRAAPAGPDTTKAGAPAPPAPPSPPAPPAPPAGGAPSGPSRTPPSRRTLIGVGAGALVAVALAVVLLAGGGGDDKKESKSSAAATAAPAGLEWRAGHDSPVARQFAASTADGGTIWVFGGIGATTSSPKTLAYDPAIDTWRSGPDLPLPLHHQMAVTYKGDPVVIGGWVPSGPNLTAQVSDRVFALQKGAWKELPKLNHPRAAAAAGVVGGKIVVVGGQADGKLVGPTEVFDGISWKDAADIPTQRDHLAAASDGKYLYAVGGRGLSADKNFTALERYDPGSDSWKKLPDMPTAAGGLGAAVVAGRLVAVGGESPTSVIDAVQSFDLKTSKWSKLPAMRTPRHGTAVAAVGDSLYAIDGAGATGHVHSTRTVEALDFGTAPAGSPTVSGLKWRSGRDAPSARQFAASTVDDHAIWLFGGLAATTSTDKVEAYDPAIDTWKLGPSLPLPVHHAMGVTYNGDPVVIGGWVASGANLTAQTSNRVFALRNGAWVDLPKLKHARAAAAAAVVGDKIVVVGGQADGKLVGPAEVFDGKSWKDAADIPTKRDHLAAASDGKYLYAVGGRELSADKNVAALERYDPGSDSWKDLPKMPTAAGGLGAAVVAGQLVAVGGESPTSVIDTVQSFDLRTNKWSKLPAMKTPRHGTTVAAIGKSLYVIAGAAATGHVHSTPTVEALDFK